MGILRRLYKVLPLLFLLPVPAALAADAKPAPLHFIGLYQFTFGAFSLGALELGIDETPDTYSLRLSIASKGLVKMFTHHTSETQANGKRTYDTFQPLHYESNYKTKNKPRHIEFAYDDKGVVIKENVIPPEDPRDRPPVPHALKDGSYDPLTTVLMICTGHQNFRAFNAKQLYQISAQPLPKMDLRLYNTTYHTVPYMLSRKPLGGMTAKETREYDKGEPQLMFFVSDDARRIPLSVNMPIYMSAVHGLLMKECATWDECRP